MRSYQGESVSSTHRHERASRVVFISGTLKCSIDVVRVNRVAVGEDVVGARWFEAAQPLAGRDPLRDVDAMSRDLGDIILCSDCHYVLVA